MFAVMKEALTLSAMNGITDHAVIHIYLHCTGLDTDFIFNPVGDDSKRLKHFIHHDPRALHEVLDKFSKIIQSGKPVVLDHKTTITVVGYEPPEGQLDLQFVGSGGYRNDKTYAYAKANELDELIDRSKGILRIQNTDHSCMARAISVGYVYQTEGNSSNRAKNIRKPDTCRGLQRNEAMRLCQKANVTWNTPCGKIEAEHFARVLAININVFEFHHTLEEVLYTTDYVPGRLEVDLLYNSETKHYDLLTNVDAVLRTIRNHHRFFYLKCRCIKYSVNHICHGCNNKNRTRFVINGETMFHNYNYTLAQESTDFHKD